MRVKLVGVKKSEYKGKDGKMKSGYNYCGLKDFNRFEQENADCEGQDVIREWSSVDFNVHPGDLVEFVYEPGFKDKATLVDMLFIEHADSNPFTEKKDAAPEKPADTKDKTKVGA